MDAAVRVTDLVKRYPGRPVNAVDGISFTVERGEVFGLLGPNGAGKTTTIGVLTTRVLPTSGAASVAGVDVAADPVTARSRLSVVPQRPNLDRALTARQNLVFHAAYHGVGRAERNRRADALLEQLGLGGRGGDKVDDYSGGMAQRLLIARALMHAPQVVFLDEPSTGLDPQARLFVWDRIRELRAGGVTVVLTTHDMDEAAALADRVGIMDHGRLLALDTPAALTRSLPGSATLDIDLERAPEDTDEAVLDALAPLAERVEQVADSSGLRARLYLSGDAAALVGPVSEALGARGARLTGVRIGEPSLEDVFLNLTGRELR
ncbi:ABC-2 type transport system ATP-binding protein [Geodermatophilus obscurus]|uniref:ABC-2 type transport system ATP-binding protein n=1 Tax=Geodermatophilus obscurus TaxID=1861 RepID=A0A1M7UFJ3_9ACTN|nr:ABC transporter ATP-binding protein [Geodermatophilus obscurus]SHN81758.1 ABC-2 type transport system ATP-binding protein [Geodermatophilus obscurus]